MRFQESLLLVVGIILTASIIPSWNVVSYAAVPTRAGVLVITDEHAIELAAVKRGWLRLSVFSARHSEKGGRIQSPMINVLSNDTQQFFWWQDRDDVILSTNDGRLVLAENGSMWAIQTPSNETLMLSKALLTSVPNNPQDMLLHVQHSPNATAFGCGRLTNSTIVPSSAACKKGSAVVTEYGFLTSFFWSTDGYAMFGVVPEEASERRPSLNLSWTDNGEEYLWKFQDPRIDLYIAPASTMLSAIQLFWQLTGTPSLLPAPALTFVASRSGWDEPPSIKQAVTYFEQGFYPLSALVSDYEWFSQSSDSQLPPTGSVSFSDFGLNDAILPGGSSFLQWLFDRGIWFGGIRWPRLGNRQNLEEARSQNCLFGEGSRNINFQRRVCRDWYTTKLKADTEAGVSFFWNTGGNTSYYTYMYWTRAQVNAFKHHISPTTTTTSTSTTTTGVISTTASTSTSTTSRETTTSSTASTNPSTQSTPSTTTTATMSGVSIGPVLSPLIPSSSTDRMSTKKDVLNSTLLSQDQEGLDAFLTSTRKKYVRTHELREDLNARKFRNNTESRLFRGSHSTSLQIGRLQTTYTRRPFSINNAFIPGMQALGAVTTPGRTLSSWEDLEATAQDIVSFAMAGTAFSTVDIGGNSPQSISDTLLARWYQLGIFTTVPRCNSARSSPPHFPFGAESPTALAAIKTALNLRVQLLPYFYSALRSQHEHLQPMARPLLFDFPNDIHVQNIMTQWMFGDALMVAPVLSEDGQRTIYFPEATWCPLHLDDDIINALECIRGSQTLTISAKLQEIPVYMKSGSLLALQGLTTTAPVVLHIYIYSGGDASFAVIQDDGLSQDGPVVITSFTWNNDLLVLSWERSSSILDKDPKHSHPSGAKQSAYSNTVRFPSPLYIGEYAVVQATLWQNGSAPVKSYARNIGASGFIDFSTHQNK
eukprot:gene9462-1704_t